MDLPILGTIDFTPTGIFLFFAATLAVVYFGWQLFGVGRAGRNVSESDETAEPGSETDELASGAPADDKGASAASDDGTDGTQKP